ncbi:MAG: thioredoxin family protein [Thermoproteota archaeon]
MASPLDKLAEAVLSSIRARLENLEREMGEPLAYVESEDEFKRTVSTARVAVVLFSTDWCNPCKVFKPVFKRVARKLSARYPHLIFVYVDTDKLPRVADRYSIENIPATAIFVNGHVAEVMVGAMPEKNLLESIERFAGAGKE